MKSLFEYDLHKMHVDYVRQWFKHGLEKSIQLIKTSAVLSFHKKNEFTNEEIAIIVDLPLENVKKILSSKEETNNSEVR